MSKSNHTPGPWTQIDAHTVRASNKVICKTLDSKFAYDEKLANARLISAAPELLEACNAVEKACAIGDWGNAIALCKAAIAKAEGKL